MPIVNADVDRDEGSESEGQKRDQVYPANAAVEEVVEFELNRKEKKHVYFLTGLELVYIKGVWL